MSSDAAPAGSDAAATYKLPHNDFVYFGHKCQTLQDCEDMLLDYYTSTNDDGDTRQHRKPSVVAREDGAVVEKEDHGENSGDTQPGESI